MAKAKSKPAPASNYKSLNNGVIAITHHYADLFSPYKEANIPDYLHLIDHSLQLSNRRYEEILQVEEIQFNTLVRQLQAAHKSLAVVFQGRDASGKSGATERIIQAIDYDPRIFLWVPIGAPTDEELQHPYLWRFMTGDRMPAHGQVRVFDRSWAERVLVERVMHLAAKKDLQHSYAEIRVFEWLLQSQGVVLVKFWLDITKAEQLKRFKARAKKKPWKVTPADDEARKNWNAYTKAANELFHRTSTETAPWYLVSSEDKLYSRVSVLQVINRDLKKALKK